jgi:hypothetical protein
LMAPGPRYWEGQRPPSEGVAQSSLWSLAVLSNCAATRASISVCGEDDWTEGAEGTGIASLVAEREIDGLIVELIGGER